jgi:hypothetical protein
MHRGGEPVSETTPALPRYRSHKIVEAAKILDVIHYSSSAIADGWGGVLRLDGFGSWRVQAEYVAKHDPKEGGYYVRYADGYESFSPAEAFEEGYTLIEDEPEVVEDPPPAPKTEGKRDWPKAVAGVAVLALVAWIGLSNFADHLKAPKAAPAAEAPQTWAYDPGPPPAPDPVTCLQSEMAVQWQGDALGRYLSGHWYYLGTNTCHVPTPRLYVRLALYDRLNVRNGFAWFIVERLQPGERLRTDGAVPRLGSTSARVMDVTTDAEALKWGQ